MDENSFEKQQQKITSVNYHFYRIYFSSVKSLPWLLPS